MNLQYARNREWLQLLDDGTAVVRITLHAQHA